MNIACIGAGYIGSVTGASLSMMGHRCTIIDIDPAKVDAINAGQSPIYEPGLQSLIQEQAGSRLFASTSYQSVYEADVVFIGVGTPSLEDGSADLSFIRTATARVANHLNPDHFTVIVIKSTVPVGTSEEVTSILEQISGLESGEHFAVASNPEFLREGHALEDVFFPDRIVVGALDDRAKEMLRELYAEFMRPDILETISLRLGIREGQVMAPPVYFETDLRSAEMIKYASNAFLAVKISYINEIARMCEAVEANVLEVAYGMGLDSRIGNQFLQVSSGWSGSCFPKDTAELLIASQKHGQELSIVKAAIESNYRMHLYIVDKVLDKLGSLHNRRIGILGLTFKPDTDDTRHTQAAVLIRRFIECGASLQVHDPKGMENFCQTNGELPVTYCHSGELVAEQADAIVLVTHWLEYKDLDWGHMHKRMKNPYVLDTRNFLDSVEIRKLGFNYEGLGWIADKGEQDASRPTLSHVV
ncbi:UDP-glucose/GDP-mannose dehydrogenase family protein [Paenibacillus sp. J2TS4]|uniref:UDP-glucose dehydrogenase family protein n=1 Tax=Paenibacillus sp. J2TS4 TaxID=2807194 RepID=UPI001AFDC5AF|nr:UDP-glucose/GDP-mannose dehydrogenase family protein [Paenibacillus sp. J2TS4]GIP36194.1 UDP-glucose 6-dehydrogenase [Paenibacillus sp. J2TS4]